MSLIRDVKTDLKSLPASNKILRNFGLVIGGILFILGLWFLLSDFNIIIRWICLSTGTILFLFGIINPSSLKKAYLIWMTFATVLGWFVSRFILVVLFFLVLTPISIVAKIFGKKFLDVNFNQRRNSYWILKERRKIDYTKMY